MKEIFKVIRKKVKLRTLIMLIILLMFNSYAWFVYATKVSSSIVAHVSSWNVLFEAGEEETSTNVKFDIGRVYPGMESYTQSITAKNKGETEAILSYEIKSVNILGTKYMVSPTLTSKDLKEKLQNDFPFKINIEVDNTNIEAESGQATLTLSFIWDFESGNDELDTYWGEQAYSYYAIHPSDNSIEIEMEITATQK